MTNTQRKPLVVCVDDDPEMLSMIVRCLRREPIEVRSTLSASEALGWIVAEDVAVLVSDYDMPEMTGAELARYSRQVRPATVRILLTGQRSVETALDGINQGEVLRFLHKPFENQQLREAVAAAVVRNQDLLTTSGDQARRQRRAALRTELEREYPGISTVVRAADDTYEVTATPWVDAVLLELAGLSPKLERS